MSAAIDTSDDSYDYILTAEDRERFGQKVKTDEYWNGHTWENVFAEDFIFSRVNAYRRKKAVQPDAWRKIEDGHCHGGAIYAWHKVLQAPFYFPAGTMLARGDYSHWQPAYPPKAGPRGKTQGERDREAAKEYTKALANCWEGSGQWDHAILGFLAGARYAREAQSNP